jgi:dihydrofolate reductase
MTKVVAIMSMSLDGYVADANDGVAEVFDWYFSGDVEVSTASTRSGMTFRVSAPSADHLRGLQAEVGAMLTGRRTFEVADGWGGQHPWDVPAFVVTHHVPDGWPRPGSTVQFVTDGIESAVARAKSAAGSKSVGVHGAQTIQQCLDARLLDEVHIDLAAVLLGAGVRLFDHLANTPVVLGNPTVVTGVGVTHLRYPVHTSSTNHRPPHLSSGDIRDHSLTTAYSSLAMKGSARRTTSVASYAEACHAPRRSRGLCQAVYVALYRRIEKVNDPPFEGRSRSPI